MKQRPFTTLFMLMSVDGKISTGSADEMDVDKDFPKIEGVREGLHQYYEIEATTDLWSLNTGRVMQKIGINDKKHDPEKINVSFVIIDNKPHLDKNGIDYLCKWVKNLVLVTTNRHHPALDSNYDNLSVVYQDHLDLPELFDLLYNEYGVKRLTIQSGGSINGELLRNKLLDYIDVIVAPVLIGGRETATLVDGKSIISQNELNSLGVLKLEHCDILNDSFIRLRYSVIK